MTHPFDKRSDNGIHIIDELSSIDNWIKSHKNEAKGYIHLITIDVNPTCDDNNNNNKNARACLSLINTKRKCSDSLPDGHTFTMYANTCQQIRGHSISLSLFTTFFRWISTRFTIRINLISFHLFRCWSGLKRLFGDPNQVFTEWNEQYRNLSQEIQDFLFFIAESELDLAVFKKNNFELNITRIPEKRYEWSELDPHNTWISYSDKSVLQQLS